MKYIERYWYAIMGVFGIFMFINMAICFLILGTLFFYTGISTIFYLKKITNKGVEGIGKILSYQVGNRGVKIPVVEFTTTDGETLTAKPFVYASTDLSKIRSYRKMIDTEVTILYDPEDPKRFVLADERSFNYFFVTVVALAGLFFIVFSICNLLGFIKFGQQ